jgi:hypothetical protein
VVKIQSRVGLTECHLAGDVFNSGFCGHASFNIAAKHIGSSMFGFHFSEVTVGGKRQQHECHCHNQQHEA